MLFDIIFLLNNYSYDCYILLVLCNFYFIYVRRITKMKLKISELINKMSK